MSFLSGLGEIVNEQFSFGENSVTSLDSNNTDRVGDFGKLGKFADKFDKSAQRSYIEDGFIRNVRPRLTETLWQEPDLTVVIKKRMFSSLVENFKSELFEENEKLFIRASKRLFQNKCRTIAAYEKLTKIERISRETGQLNSYMIPQLLGGIAELEAAGADILKTLGINSETRQAFDTLRKVFAFSEPTSFTTWLIDSETAYMSSLGEGAGTFELTMVQSINSKVSTQFMNGGGNLVIEDPYKLMIVTENDIDQAISDSTSFRNGSFGRFVEIQTRRLIDDLKTRLNSERADRGAVPIRFVISPETIVSKRVRAIISQEGTEINFTFNSGLVGLGSNVTVDLAARSGPNGLSTSEVGLFKEIITNTFLLLGFENTTRSEVVEFNRSTNYVRRKMRLHFGEKAIIQPLDVVNIFISSKSQFDDSLTSGFNPQPTSFNFATTVNSLIKNISSNFADISSFFKGGLNSEDEVEKTAIVGSEFPTWLWRLYRNDFTRQAAGVATFVGIVDSVVHNYDNGKYTLQVSCEDNAGYFNKSQVNFTPSLDVFNGPLYDPLTPFDISFDGSTGVAKNIAQGDEFPPLLPENITLFKSGALKFKAGRLRGGKVRDIVYGVKDKENKTESRFDDMSNVLNDPDGFVYRWKEGIESITKTEPSIKSSQNAVRPPKIQQSPYAGQDVMNVLSLLITGQPYNFNTFLKSAVTNIKKVVSKDDVKNKNTVVHYIDGLINSLNERNAVWGNFVPFKKLSINEAALEFIKSGQSDFIKKNTKLEVLLNERAALIDNIAISSSSFAKNPKIFSTDLIGQLNPNDIANIDNHNTLLQIGSLNRQIESTNLNLQNTIETLATKQDNGKIKIIGDDISLDPSFSQGENSITEKQRKIGRDEFRKNINFLTQRRLWEVKANEDTNLFIVDDQYDKNFDIQAFEKKIAPSLNLFASEYMSIDSKIREVSELLGLEIFSDSQGHIQCRPPGYNKVPSSVFFRMFKEKVKSGRQVFPQFLENLFFNQLQSLTKTIEIVEDQIRLRVLSLGVTAQDERNPDSQIQRFLSGSAQGMPSGDYTFIFASSPNDGKIGESGFRALIDQSNPDFNEENNSKALTQTSTVISNASQASNLFNPVSRSNTVQKLNFKEARSARTSSRLDDIRKRLETKGSKGKTAQELFSNERLGGESQLDALKVINEISTFVSERQTLLKSISNVLRNLSEGIQLNNETQGNNSGLFPMLGDSIPEILEHMIEDESNHSFGPGSGGRFIVRDSQIIKLSIEEKAPPYTAVTVNGLLGEGIVETPQKLKTDNNGGNFITTAFAVDYDMWRMYGFKAPASISAPFFSDPATQCAPYAVFRLNLARKNILQGNLTVAGNEYYQAGDVIYIEDRDLLFYVDEVSQNFTYGSNFTTSLSLKYGHKPGEYIPTILDIVGKGLYNTGNFAAKYRHSRHGQPSGDVSIDSIMYDNSFGDTGTINELIKGSRGEYNRRVLKNILFRTSGVFSQIGSNNKVPKIQLRLYSNSDVPNTALESVANSLKDWLVNPQKFASSADILPSTDENEGFLIEKENVEIIVINTNGDSKKSPSQVAWNSVRTLQTEQITTALTVSTDEFEDPNKPKLTVSDLDQVLFNHIIDIWLTFSNKGASTTKPKGELTDQASQNSKAAAEAAAKRRREQG